MRSLHSLAGRIQLRQQSIKSLIHFEAHTTGLCTRVKCCVHMCRYETRPSGNHKQPATEYYVVDTCVEQLTLSCLPACASVKGW